MMESLPVVGIFIKKSWFLVLFLMSCRGYVYHRGVRFFDSFKIGLVGMVISDGYGNFLLKSFHGYAYLRGYLY